MFALFRQHHLFNSQLIYGIKIALSLAGAVLIPLLLGSEAISIPAILGVVAAGLTELDDNLRGRIRTVLFILLSFFIAASGVEFLFGKPIPFFIGIVVASFLFVILGAFGERYATIAFGVLVIAIYTMLAYKPDQAWYIQPLLLVGGALWYNLIALFFALFWPTRPLQESLANTFDHLSAYLEVKSHFFDPDEGDDFEAQKLALARAASTLRAMIDDTRRLLMRRVKSDRGKRSAREVLSYLLAAEEIFERANSSHAQYDALRAHFRHSDILFRFQRLMMEQALACGKIADELSGRGHFDGAPRLPLSADHLEASLSYLEQHHYRYAEDGLSHPQHQREHQEALELTYSMKALLKNLRAINLLITALKEVKESSVESSYLSDFITETLHEPLKGGAYFKALWQQRWKQLSKNMTRRSELFRHAVRMSVALGVGYLCVLATYRLIPLITGEEAPLTTPYWILLTIVFVCQPNYSATKARLIKRLWGTLFGVIIALLLLYFGLSRGGQMVVVVLSGTLFFTFRRARYAYATAFITIMVLMSFNLIDAGFVAPERLVDTIIGCLLSWLVVTYIWPDWRFRDLGEQIDSILNANLNYLRAIGYQYHQGRDESLAYLEARDGANGTDGALTALFSSLSVEPKKNEAQLTLVFDLLCLNNTVLGYISALGAHRTALTSKELLNLMDESIEFVAFAFNAGGVSEGEIEPLRQRLKEMKAHYDEQEGGVEGIALQQLILLLKILPEYLHHATVEVAHVEAKEGA